MKRTTIIFLVLSIFISMSYGQARTVTINCPAFNVTYGTGRCTSSEKMDGRIELSPANDPQPRTGWALFNVSAIPELAVIEEVVLHVYHSSLGTHSIATYVRGLTVDPITSSGPTIYWSKSSGTQYLDIDIDDNFAAEWTEHSLSGTIATDILDATDGEFGIIFDPHGTTNEWTRMNGHDSSQSPYLEVTYSVVVEGSVSGTWQQSYSPYYVNSDLTVDLGNELIIEPGVEVIFNGYYKMTVYGRLEAVGTESDMILFTNTSPEAEGWHRICFLNIDTNGQDPSTIDYCQFQYGDGDYGGPGGSSEDDGGAILCEYSSNLTISNSIFCNNKANYGGAISCRYNSNITIDRCMIYDNETNENSGAIMCIDADPIIINCLITGSSHYGIWNLNGAGPTLVNCILRNNALGSIFNYNGAICNVTYSDIEGGWEGTGNIDTDPQWDEDYYLTWTGWPDPLTGKSPCINTGDPSILDPDGSRSDIGLYPFMHDTALSGTWLAEWSPIVISNYSEVPSGSTLNIMPGCEILFGGRYSINVKGNMQAVGTEDNPIHFDSNIDDATWLHMEVTDINGTRTDTIRFVHCIFENGQSGTTNPGGALYCKNSDNVLVQNCIIRSCYGHHGGAMYLLNSDIHIDHCLMHGNNTNNHGGAIYCNNCSPTIEFCTITGNSSNDSGALFCYNNSGPHIENSILWNNTPNEITFHNSGAACAVHINYCDLSGGIAGIETNSNGTVYSDYGIIDADPLFAEDYFLTWANYPVQDETMSPCIDAGDPAEDYDPDGTIADMGAFYYEQAIIAPDSPVIASAVIQEGSVLIDWGEVSGANSYNVYSAEKPEGPFILDETGTFDGTSWSAPVPTDVRKFYRVTAEN